MVSEVLLASLKMLLFKFSKIYGGILTTSNIYRLLEILNLLMKNNSNSQREFCI